MELGEIKQFPRFEMTSQNTKTSGGGGSNHVLFIYIHTMVFINGRALGEETSSLRLQYPNLCPWSPALALY